MSTSVAAAARAATAIAGIAAADRSTVGFAESNALHGQRLSPSLPSLSPCRKPRRSVIVAMAPKKKVNSYDDSWNKQWFGAGIFLEDIEENNVNIFSKLEKLKVLSTVEKAGLLSKAESAGLSLSKIEQMGLLSKAEELGLLSLVESLASTSPAAIASFALPLFVASILSLVLIPDDTTLQVVLQYSLAGAFGLGCVTALGGSFVLGSIQDAEE
eukprot:TRINITY_DN84_c0_g1_i1.p1 TRINITY_DN84_c0_g1~~TRINITY_DN84_c0_g1_i1.p1  ORF type:complete len:214 (-),score=57.11 TRINITY_DN84_c0_g1_i1:181-822(-)